MQSRLNSFFSRYEFLLPLFVFALFLAVSLPGNNWGAPALWNPDELIWRVDMALGGHMQFDVSEPDFNYPSLPKYAMCAIGAVTYGMGKSSYAFIVAARSFSALLGALGGVLIYYLGRMLGADKKISLLAGFLYIASGVAAANGRFAHNDLYLQLFSILTVYFIVKYQYTNSALPFSTRKPFSNTKVTKVTKEKHPQDQPNSPFVFNLFSANSKLWLYLSFFSVGLAASSKYTGGSLILLPMAVYLSTHWREFPSRWLAMAGKLFLGGLISYLGYGLGTPRSLIDPINYFTDVFVALRNYPQYGFNSGTTIGLFGQWAVFERAVGTFAYYLFIAAFVWFTLRLVLWKLGRGSFDDKRAQGVTVLLAAVLIFDLPFMISINYIERYFIPFVPFLAILAALFADEILRLASDRKLVFVQPAVATLLAVGIAYSLLRLVSTALLFMNDARIPASDYIAGIRGYQKSIEYTLYPPLIEKRRFERAHNYPIYFVKYPNDEVPTGGRFEYNQGEQGLLERDTDYFVIDSYTYDRFYTESVCATNPVECDFFKRLLAGEVKTYRPLKEFRYRLPPWLPPVSVSAVNPDVLIFERVR
ncbi:MAG: phospholipid carrier-dependent glycosyltransferase [Chloroflexi bacterium]|nr:phospholipid carrier-dependent glycosyltransferase [Chloroflexota bacterium]